MPKITISFKHNKEDLELYNEIMKHSDKSGYVKDVMKGHMPKGKVIEVKEEEDNNLLHQFKRFNFS